MTAPKTNWQEALDIALECSLYPSLNRSDFVATKLRLRKRITSPESDYWFVNQVAKLVASASPGLVAPWGSPSALSNITLNEIKKIVSGSAAGNRLAIAMVGDLPIASAAKRIARRISHLPKGSVSDNPKDRFLPTPDPKIVTARSRDSHTYAVVAWQIQRSVFDTIGAEAFIKEMRKNLMLQPGIVPVWNSTGSFYWYSWAGIALRVNEGSLSQLDQTVVQTARRISKKAIRRSIDRIHKEKDKILSFRRAQLDLFAEQLSKETLEPRHSIPSQEISVETAQKLIIAPPTFLIARPENHK